MKENKHNNRFPLFLQDVFTLAISAFGGPQAHIAMMLDLLVGKRKYVSEGELIELNALCQILPGPTSTQTITAIGYKLGGMKLALITLLIWIIPAGSFMIVIAIGMSYLESQGVSTKFTKYIQPMAVAFVAFAAYKITTKVINTKSGLSLLISSAIIAYIISTLYGHLPITSVAFPILLTLGGLATSLKFRKHKKIHDKKLNIEWHNFILFLGVFVGAVTIGNIFQFRLLRLFENFYRNGSLIFGGGQVLIPLLRAEFVDVKHYLTDHEFLSGISFTQAMPGPVFSMTGYLGATAMNDKGVFWQILGGIVALLGIFLPGTFLIFFVIKFWTELKKFRAVRASLEGISAVGSGLVIAATILLWKPINTNINAYDGIINISIIGITFLLLLSEKVPTPLLIIIGLVAGFVF
ncbi:MAG: chromate efflux transporter [Cytophagales bacterium]|nr:chromate efflux transporter [Cytophagales bacterium]